MNTRTIGLAALLCAIVSPAFAMPDLVAVPGGIQSTNWVWTIDITPDLSLIPDGSGTPLALELGFRLTGAKLLNATITDPVSFDTPNPGTKIFGWETLDPNSNNRPYGLQKNLVTGEIFAAYGSENFTSAGARHFLTITAAGPGNVGGATSSTLQWLGAYGTGGVNGRITQITGLAGNTYTAANFDVFHGLATQSIPEPMSGALLAIGAIFVPWRRRLRAV